MSRTQKTYIVDAEKGPYRTIQAAIDDILGQKRPNLARIKVKAGHYDEPVTIDGAVPARHHRIEIIELN